MLTNKQRFICVIIALCISFTGYGQYEFLLHKSYAERYPAFDSIFNGYAFLQLDSAAAYRQINDIKRLAEKEGDEDLVLEALLGECSYLLYGKLSLSQYRYSSLYGKAHNSDLYISKLNALLKLAEEQDNITMQIRTHILLGLEYHERDKLVKALTHFSKFNDLIREVPFEKFPTKKHFLLYMGKFFYNFEDYDAAEPYLQYAKTVPPSYMIHEEADVYNTLGLIKRQQAEHDSALYYFSKAQEIAWKQGSTTWRHILGGNIGIVYYLRGEYDKAMPFLMNDIATSLERNDYSNAINSTVKLADIYYRQKKYDSARYYADMGRWIVDSVHPPHKYLVPLYELKGRLAAERGDMAGAYRYMDSALAAKDSLPNNKYLTRLMVARRQLEHNINSSAYFQLESEKQFSIFQRNAALVGILLFFIIGCIVIYYRNRQKQAKKRLEEDRLANARKRLDEFTRTVQEKNRLLETSEAEIKKLREQLLKTNEEELPEEIINRLHGSTILTDDEWEDFRQMFEQVHSGFLYRLKDNAANLSPAETRLLALCKLKLDNKEMAGTLGISVSTVRNHKFRLRKKLNLADDEALYEFVQNI